MKRRIHKRPPAKAGGPLSEIQMDGNDLGIIGIGLHLQNDGLFEIAAVSSKKIDASAVYGIFVYTDAYFNRWVVGNMKGRNIFACCDELLIKKNAIPVN